MALTKEERLRRVHEDALRDFDTIQMALRDERLQCLQDRRFATIAGAQWEGALGQQFANKPMFEVNKIHLAVIRIINEYRNNRITVDFVSKDGSPDDKFADACDGLYRADEQESVADEAYDNAFEEAVLGGFGAWRLRAKYENEDDDDDERQRVCIEPIFDADSSVFFDLNAKRQDKSDAKRCYVLTAYAKSSYIEQWEDDPSSWPKAISQVEFDWETPDVVYVAEYYKVEEVKEVITTFRGITGAEVSHTSEELEEDPSILEALAATGYQKVDEKKRKRRRVHKYIMSGGGVLEDCGYIAGSCIPVIPVYGKRWYIDNVERCMGHVRLSKDVQRLKNMQLSKLGEISALSSVEKPILTPEQISGHVSMWSDDNIKNYPYLLINPMTDPVSGQQVASGPIAYTRAPSIPPAMAALLQITEQDISDLLGNQQAGEEIQANISGKAVELIQNRLDMQAFIYMSNMAKAVKRCGEVWLSMMRDIAVEKGRKMKTVGLAGEVGSIELMKKGIDPKTGAAIEENDFSKATFDVAVDVGPSSSSKRAATVRALTGIMAITQDPETLNVLGSTAIMNIEGEGLADIRAFFRKRLVRMGVVQPTEQERAELEKEAANQPPDANQQYLEAAAGEATARATKANADTALSLAKAEQAKADTAKILADIDIDKRNQIISIIDRMTGQQ